jgi:hypothetical protein
MQGVLPMLASNVLRKQSFDPATAKVIDLKLQLLHDDAFSKSSALIVATIPSTQL